MNAILPSDIRSISEFEAVRPSMQQRIIALKKHRRINIGDEVSLVFENRETMLWQIHEMVRVERMVAPEAVAHECETYSRLLPTDHALSATLFLEFAEGVNIRERLDTLVGIDEHTSMIVGDTSVRAEFDPGQYSADRISAVHYIRFVFDDSAREKFLDSSVPVSIRIDHPTYSRRAPVDGETRRSLSDDLRG